MVRLVKKIIKESESKEPEIIKRGNSEIFYPYEDAIEFMKIFENELMMDKKLGCSVEGRKKIETLRSTGHFLLQDLQLKYKIPWSKEDSRWERKQSSFKFDKGALYKDPLIGFYEKLSYFAIKWDSCCDGEQFICDDNFKKIFPPKIETEDRINNFFKKEDEKIRKEMASNLFFRRFKSAKSIPELVALYDDVENNDDLDEDYQEGLLGRIYEKYKMLGGE